MASDVGRKYDIYPRTLDVPRDLWPYWNEESQIPNDVQFYGGARIAAISIRIFRERIFTIENPKNGMKYQIQEAAVKAKTSDCDLFKIGLHLFPLRRFNKEDFPTTVNVYIKNSQGKKQSVKLPAEMASKLAQYLNEGRPNTDFTCVQFVHFLNGVYDEREPSALNKYIMRLCDEKNLSPGDSVLFLNKFSPCHAAIYLTGGLYLWHSANRCLRVSSYEEMKRVFSITSMQKLELREKVILLQKI